jgi:hypothetical protein
MLRCSRIGILCFVSILSLALAVPTVWAGPGKVVINGGDETTDSLDATLSVTTPTSNLLVNGSAEAGDMSGWTIEKNGGDGWKVIGDNYDDDGTSFVTSFQITVRSQTVDLLAAGYTADQLDAAPDIVAGEYYKGKWPKFDDKYQLKIELRDANGAVIDSYDSGLVTTTEDWVWAGQTFSNYGPGVRSVYFQDRGQDAEYWAGFYGAIADAAEVGLGGGAQWTDVRFSNDGETWGDWQPMADSYAWKLAPGGGEKTVSVQFLNDVGEAIGGVSDTIEVTIVDMDEDGVLDADDNCLEVKNPDQTDGDGDSIGDVCDACPSDPDNDMDKDAVCGDVDNCPSDPNPEQTNSDGDKKGDACDACPLSEKDDIDSDGVCADVDNCPNSPNPEQADGDGDGLGDPCDPCTLDPDKDLVCDNADNCPEVDNADQGDSDKDGIGDVCDNCPADANPDQVDSDNDGTGDACGTDDDSDGIDDEDDNCPDHANPGQEDFDQDGAGDACDSDDDGDGVSDLFDTCPTVKNAGDGDMDGDGVGDACDDDVDGDEVNNDDDNCSMVANAPQGDMDDDGLGDVCDDDMDGDGLENQDELDHGLDPAMVDSDEDGLDDQLEWGDGESPADTDQDGDIDALDDDSDDDGMLDSDDPCPIDADPLCGQVVADPDPSDVIEDDTSSEEDAAEEDMGPEDDTQSGDDVAVSSDTGSSDGSTDSGNSSTIPGADAGTPAVEESGCTGGTEPTGMPWALLGLLSVALAVRRYAPSPR